MGKAIAHWTDARLDEFAAAFEPVPAQVAVLDATVKHFDHLAAVLEPVPVQLAVLAATAGGREPRPSRRTRGHAAPTPPDRLGSRGRIARHHCRTHHHLRLTTEVRVGLRNSDPAIPDTRSHLTAPYVQVAAISKR